MQKRLFVILLTLCTMLAVFAIGANAADYFVDATNGSDDNNGTTEASALATFDAAMQKAAADATNGETVTVYIIGAVSLSSTAYQTPAFDGTVVIEGKNDTDACVKVTSNTYFYMNGAMTFKNIKFDHTAQFHIVAQNHKLVLDEGVTTRFAEGYRIYVYGSEFEPTAESLLASDVTIRSGKYDLVTAGTRFASGSSVPMKGTVSITIGAAEGCEVSISRFAPFSIYSGELSESVNGTVIIDGAATIANFAPDHYYGIANTTEKTSYNVDVILRGDLTVTAFAFTHKEATTVNYTVYADKNVDTAEDDAAIFVLDSSYITIDNDEEYTTYCDDYIGHTFAEDVCTNCGLAIADCGHTFTESEITTVGTCKTPQAITYTCKSCGNVSEPVIGTTVPLNHEADAYNYEVLTSGEIKFTYTCCDAEIKTVTPDKTEIYVSETATASATSVDGIGAMDKAFADFDLGMQYAALVATEDKIVTVYVDGTVAVGDNDGDDNTVSYVMPTYAGTVKVVGTDGAVLDFGTVEKRFLSNGSLEISNVAITNTTNLHIVAQGNKLVLGTGITMTKTGKVLVYGDHYESENTPEKTDVTVRSGSYSLVTAGPRSNVNNIKGNYNLTVGATDENDTLTINRLAPFSVYHGTPAKNTVITATVTVDGKVTVQNWFADRAYGKQITNGSEFAVDLYLNGDITDNANMFICDADAKGSTVTYNVYYDTEDEVSVADAALFNDITKVHYDTDGETVIGTSKVIVNKHTATDAGYTMSIVDGKAVFKCACCDSELVTTDIATTIYVSANGVTLARDVDKTIGTTEATAFADFDMAMNYAAAAATEGVTVTVKAVGAVSVPYNESGEEQDTNVDDNDNADDSDDTVTTESTSYTAYNLPSYKGTISIVGADDNSSLVFDKNHHRFVMNGALSFENIYLNHSDKLHIVAQNNKLVLGKGITTNCNLDPDASGSKRIYVYGGYYEPTEEFEINGHITVLSGNYEIVTAGSRQTQGYDTPLVVGGTASIVLGADGETVSINRFSPYGVWGNVLSGSDANATVKIAGTVNVSGAWHMGVMYAPNSTTDNAYNIDLVLQGDVNVIGTYSGRSRTYAINYNVYYDERVDGTEEDAAAFAAVKGLSSAVLTTTVDTYYTYCAEKLGGHSFTDKANKCQTCDECGYTEHEISANAVWVKDGDNYTFSCECGEEKLTAVKPYVYVGGYIAGTYDENGVQVDAPIYAGENDAMGTLEAPVKTVDEAVRRLSVTGGDVILTDSYDIYNDVSLPAYAQTVTFSSVLDDDGKALYGFRCMKLGACFNMNGPTAFENIKFDMPGRAKTTHESTGEEVMMDMTLVFAAHYNDLTFGNGISTLGKAYVVAGTNRLSAAAPEPNTDERTVTLTFNKVETREDSDTGVSKFYTNIYLGDRVKYIQSDYVLENKNVTAVFNDAECGYIYASTTSPSSYQSKTDSGETGDIENDSDDVVDDEILTDDTTDDTTEDTTEDTDVSGTYARDIVQLDNCHTTIIFNGSSSAALLNTGHQNAYNGSTSLDSLTVYLNGNSTIGASETASVLAIQLYNVKDLKIYVSNDDDTEDWVGEGKREVALEKRIHASLSGAFLEYRAEQEGAGKTLEELTAYIKYSAHTTAVYPRVNYGYDKVTRDYTNDHSFELDSTTNAYVCTVCKKTMADAAMSPVVVTAKPVSAENGKITVEYIISATAHSAYNVKETVNSVSFDIVAPAGYTLEKIRPLSLADGTKDQVAGAWVGIVDGNTFTVKCIDSNGTITRTGAICQATFTYDPTSAGASDVDGYYVTNVKANRLNDSDEIEPAVVYSAASKTYTQSFYLGVTLKSEYVLEYIVPVDSFVSDCMMVFEKDGKTTVVYPYEENGMWRFTAPSIAGKEMNDTIKATYCYIGTDGMLYTAETKSYNLVTYYNVMKPYFENEAYAGLGDVLNAMFNYGAAAQTYFSYNTENLATEHLEEADAVDYTTTKVEAVNESDVGDNVEGQLYTPYTQYAVLEQRILMTLVFKPEDTIDTSALAFKAEYKDINGALITIEIDGEDMYTDTINGVTYLCVDVDTVAAKDLRQEFTGALYSGDTQVSPTVTTSFEAYAAVQIETSSDQNLVAVCRAALAYSDAAAEYLKKTEQ